MARLLLVDDEPNILKSVGGALEREGHVVATAGNLAEARLQMASDHDAVLLDVWLPDGSGLDWLTELKAAQPNCVVIMISGHAQLSDAVSATRRGAFDFLEKPLSLERLLITLDNGLGMERLRQERLRQWQSEEARYAVLGSSRAIRDLLATIAQVAAGDVRVLIRGENGTGKELVARQLHRQSRRATGPFVALNCAALPENLIESELFGFEKGAFTGATRAQAGKFEEAHGGTLFLDEVGDLPPAAQAKVLRVLEESSVRRLGANRERQVDVRVVTATNRNLEQMVQQGAFRQDLLFRLNVVPIDVPPLREHSEDVETLALHFLKDVTGVSRAKRFSREALEALRTYSFPGNVRELRNMVERAAILTPAEEISKAHVLKLFPELSAGAVPVRAYAESMDEAEREIVRAALAAAGWNVSRAAELLKLERSHLHKKIKALGLERPE
jgi:two-component system, NtrC family, nitrogen regulation response regulator NtrX